ncbi:MAG: hypothetical protein KTR35_12310 [Gammaproteobacteria bacterium]|nr:hypothetical protein [Gammaproteobacteria bacterium]
MLDRIRPGLLATTFLSSALIVACGNDTATEEDPKPLIIIEEASSKGEANAIPVVPKQMPSQEQPLSAVFGASNVPYPIYPNGKKYRVGGENGLKIVVFQTDDTFSDVDQYYSNIGDSQGMPRLSAMTDYVRYSQSAEDLDPWATHKPGIVIHRFKNEAERRAVGASASAKTNIIMSF